MGPGDHRHRHQRDRRHPGVDQRHRDRPERDDPLQVARLDVDVGGEVGSGLDAGVGEHGDDGRVDDVPEAGAGEEVELRGEAVGVPDDEHADDDHRQLQADVGEGEKGERALAPPPGDVEDVEDADGDDDEGGDADLQAGLAEAGGDRLQVVGNRDRRQGDHDQVVDQDRPAGDEGDQLVEGVAGEGGGAAALAEHRAALDVAERGEGEEHAGGEEDQRREAEAAGRRRPRARSRSRSRPPSRRRRRARGRRGRVATAAQSATPPCLRPAHRSIRDAAQSRPAPTATKATPITTPTESGPPPAARVATRMTRPRARKTSEKARIGAAVDPLGRSHRRRF